MIVNILLLILGFVLLIKGADFIVDGASSTAENFKLSKTFVGLTVMALGTSLPEFAISMSALANGSTNMVLGNVVGSNILNILLILGLAATINPIIIRKNTIKKELPLLMLISTLLVTLFLDVKLSRGAVNEITRADGIVILLFFTIFLYYLIMLVRQKKNESENSPKFSLLKSIIFIIIGIVGIILGSNMVVLNATSIANAIGLSERIISLTVIAIGTSLPELVTTLVSAKKDEQDLLVGNIIGSNIFNICIVLGIPVTIYGTISSTSFQNIDLIMLIGSSILLFIFAYTKKKITRLEGILMVLTFMLYNIILFFTI